MAGTIGLMLGALLWLGAAADAAEFEARPVPFRTVARPADGETLSVTPPCFVYPATKLYDAYVIEVSRKRDFSDSAQRFAGRYMLYAPHEAMAPGRYFWRWRPGKIDDGQTEWSAVRAFTIADDATAVPFPDVAAVARRIGASHPRVAISAAELPELRQRALVAFGPQWLARVKRIAEQMRDKPLLPEPDYLPDVKDPHRAEVYQKTFRTTRPFMRELATLAENYLLTGDELSGQEAHRRLLHLVAWDPRGSTSLRNNDEAGTEIVRFCPTALDRIAPLLSAAEKQRCLDCFVVRMSEMRDRWRRRPFEMYPYESHNMGYYLPDLLEASLALVGEAPVEEMLDYTMLQLWSPFYPPYGGSDGGWAEGPSYWGWSTQVFARLYRLVHLATGAPVEFRSNLRNASLFKLYDNPPYFKMSPFGDGQESPAGGWSAMSMLAALYGDPYAKWYADQRLHGPRRRHRLSALLFDDSQVAAKAPTDLPPGRAFCDVGLAAMHSALADPTKNVALLLRSCPFGSISHAYADQNTFALDVYGEPLIIASGYYQLYGHPHHAQWTRQTKASNSVLVNGQGQCARDWNAKGRLAAFETTAAGDYAVGDATQAYGGRLDRFVRRVVFLRPVHTGGEPIIVIRDELAAPRLSTFQFLLHAVNKMDVDPETQRVVVAKGASRCRVDYLAPVKLAFHQDDRFPVAPFRPMPNQWHLTASTEKPARDIHSLIVIQPYHQGDTRTLLKAHVESQPGYTGVRLIGANRTVVVLFRTADNAAEEATGPLVTRAAAASFRIVAGKVESVVEFGGAEPDHARAVEP